MSADAGPRFEVRVVDEVFAEDLIRSARAARAAIELVVTEVRRDDALRVAAALRRGKLFADKSIRPV